MLTVALALAFFIGILLGLLGGGGSILMVPVLLYVLRMEPKSALASTQVILAATSAVAVVVHARASRVVFSVGTAFGIAGMAGAYLGGRTARSVPTKLLLLGFTALMAISAVAMLRRRSAAATERPPPSLVRGAAVGSATGFLAGLLGVGGGFLTTPLMIFYGIPPTVAAASAASQVTGASVSGVFAHHRRGGGPATRQPQRARLRRQLAQQIALQHQIGNGLGIVHGLIPFQFLQLLTQSP